LTDLLRHVTSGEEVQFGHDDIMLESKKDSRWKNSSVLGCRTREQITDFRLQIVDNRLQIAKIAPSDL
jgi:hypothetical protein